MSDPFSSIPRRIAAPGDQRDALRNFSGILIGTIVVAALYVGREIFVPIAIAVLLSFVLAPLVRFLRGLKVGRGLSVAIVVIVAFTIIFGIGAVIARQMSELATELPRFQTTISLKIDSMRGAAFGSGAIKRASAWFKRVGEELAGSNPAISSGPGKSSDASSSSTGTPATSVQQPRQPIPVEIHEPDPSPFKILETVIATVLQPLATTGIVLVFVVFILLQREDLRDRLIRLAGSHDLQKTTAAIDDAARRLSRFFLMQTAINTVFGIVIGTGLAIIGVPSPILWGILGMLMRFVPYIGSFIAAALPVGLAAAVEPGWTMVIATLALFLVTEPIMGQVIEPWLYGHSTGLSPIAVIVAATFWTWLWGPIGLLLATPLTVCLVVLGRHVEPLEFLDVMLGDRPALTPVESFYQRMLAGDPNETADQAEQLLKQTSLSTYYDSVAIPGLLMAQADVRRGVLDESRQARLKETLDELMDDLSDHDDVTQAPPETSKGGALDNGRKTQSAPEVKTEPDLPKVTLETLAPNWRGETPVVCVAGGTPLDEAAASMLAQLLEKHGIAAKVEPAELLSISRILRFRGEGVAMVCLSYLDAEPGSAHVRFAVRRMRRRVPTAQLMTCFWNLREDTEAAKELCAKARADVCATNLREALSICIAAAQSGPQEHAASTEVTQVAPTAA